jgi:hypothetical protein
VLDLERGVKTTRADIDALRRLRASRRLSTAEYLRALAHLPEPSPGVRRSKKDAWGGEPFRLP